MKRPLLKHINLILFLGLIPISSSAATKPAGNAAPVPIQLNIVFHGMFSYVFWPDHLEVLAPQVDEHFYKAGTWGKEVRLKESTVYQLSGIKGVKVRPKIDGHNLLLQHVENIDRSPEKLFCSFVLPLPKEIHGIRIARANGPIAAGRSLEGNSTAEIPLVQTLIYTVEDMRQVGLSNGFSWNPQINEMGTINLHVWAEPEIDLLMTSSTGHATQAFTRLMGLFPGVDLHLEFGAAAPVDKITGIRGLNGWEENSLVERQLLLFPPGQQKQKRKGTEVSNCVGLIVLND